MLAFVKMGGSGSREKTSCRETEKMKVMAEEINRVVEERKQEAKAREKERMVFAVKEQAWKQERKKMKEEAKLLRKMVEDKEETAALGGGLGVGREKEREALGNVYLIEQLKEERARRDEAVHKWKQLYLDIKTELDHLILRTHNGLPLSLDADGNGVCCCRAEEMVEGLIMELEEKKKTIDKLQAKLDSLEQERQKRERDRDILRQSLRIISSSKEASKMKMKIAVKQKHAQNLP